MAIEFCQCCHAQTECKVIGGERNGFEKPYMNAYVRKRRCESCHGSFTTYEIGEDAFLGMRNCVYNTLNNSEELHGSFSMTKTEFDTRHSPPALAKLNVPVTVEDLADALNLPPFYVVRELTDMGRSADVTSVVPQKIAVKIAAHYGCRLVLEK